VDRVRVKGKAQPITILEPLARRDLVAPDVVEALRDYTAALAAYRARDWDTALAAFDELTARQPTTTLYRLYRQRSAAYQVDPPASDWDGVFTHQNK
jgi:adenylate cyclase